jgi:hypothetical protein
VGRPLTQVLVSETKRNWPFVVGFAVTFTLVAKLSASLDREYSLPFLLLFTSLTMLAAALEVGVPCSWSPSLWF